MTRISVKTAPSYDVVIGDGILVSAGREIKRAMPCEKYLVITDDGVPDIYFSELKKSLEKEGAAVLKKIIPRGEKNKNFPTLESILETAAENRLTRGDGMIALGGGVVGDVTGLAAALYMRGVKYAQVPTTLLAAIDSSVGGKTAVDLEAGKNLAGAFYQPSVVLCDVKTFLTLPVQEWQCGMGEGVKYGLLSGGKLWESVKTFYFDKNKKCLLSRKNREFIPVNIAEFVGACVSVKAKIVQEDEREKGLRKILNLGHTVGHAIEKLSAYSLPHGVCVAKGIVRTAEAFPEYFGQETRNALYGIFSELGIDVSCPYAASELVSAIGADKKNYGNGVSLALIKEPGEPFIKDIEFNELEKRL